MKNQKNKTKISTFAFVLMLTISALLVALTTVNAQTYGSYIYVAVSRDPIGVSVNRCCFSRGLQTYRQILVNKMA